MSDELGHFLRARPCSLVRARHSGTRSPIASSEVIRRSGPWRNLKEVEFATLEWVDWFNHQRLLEPIGEIPPAEFEAMYYERQESSAMVVGLN